MSKPNKPYSHVSGNFPQEMFHQLEAWFSITTGPPTKEGKMYSNLLDHMCDATDEYGKELDEDFTKVNPERDWPRYLKLYIEALPEGDSHKLGRLAWRLSQCFQVVSPTFEEVTEILARSTD